MSKKWKARSATDKDAQQLNSGTYKVQSGDTLWAIARKLGISVDELMSYNGITDPRKLKVGTNLVNPRQAKVQEMQTESRRRPIPPAPTQSQAYDSRSQMSHPLPSDWGKGGAPDPFDEQANALDSGAFSPLDLLSGGAGILRAGLQRGGRAAAESFTRQEPDLASLFSNSALRQRSQMDPMQLAQYNRMAKAQPAGALRSRAGLANENPDLLAHLHKLMQGGEGQMPHSSPLIRRGMNRY